MTVFEKRGSSRNSPSEFNLRKHEKVSRSSSGFKLQICSQRSFGSIGMDFCTK